MHNERRQTSNKDTIPETLPFPFGVLSNSGRAASGGEPAAHRSSFSVENEAITAEFAEAPVGEEGKTAIKQFTLFR